MQIIKVLIVEDSKLMQELLAKILSQDSQIKVVGIAEDPFVARDLIKAMNPDVITLDIMLPYMDGLTFLKNLMRLRPMPVVMISSLTDKGSAIAIEALSMGAVDYYQKPSHHDLADLSRYSKTLIDIVKNAATANVKKHILPENTEEKVQKIFYEVEKIKNDIIVVGASTGGIEAIEAILLQLPKVLPPMIVVQHIRKEFSAAFSKRISQSYGLTVVTAEHAAEILPSHIYMAPGDSHVLLNKIKNSYFIELNHDLPFNGHKPSIDMLFHSVAAVAGANTIGILLTGMGVDGAEGLKAIHDAGGTTIVQDKETSVVWGMPGAAVKKNAVDHILAINKIPQKILQIIDERMHSRMKNSS